MRLWSVNPCCLNSKGLVALWREALLARAVLQGKTIGYRHHPQVARFRAASQPIAAINAYLLGVYGEALARGYHFDAAKLGPACRQRRLPVSRGQVLFEWRHLQRKLWQRDRRQFRLNQHLPDVPVHPLFRLVSGLMESWERGSQNVPPNSDRKSLPSG